MFITLLKDIPSLGKKTERILVSDAYARNVLIPQRIGIVGEQTPFKIQKAKPLSSVDLEGVAEKLKEPISISRKMNEKGGLYEKVDKNDIMELLKKRLHVDESQIKVSLTSPLHEAGEHTIAVAVSSKKFDITLRIET